MAAMPKSASVEALERFAEALRAVRGVELEHRVADTSRERSRETRDAIMRGRNLTPTERTTP